MECKEKITREKKKGETYVAAAQASIVNISFWGRDESN
jgi:hypothetical protein